MTSRFNPSSTIIDRPSRTAFLGPLTAALRPPMSRSVRLRKLFGHNSVKSSKPQHASPDVRRPLSDMFVSGKEMETVISSQVWPPSCTLRPLPIRSPRHWKQTDRNHDIPRCPAICLGSDGIPHDCVLKGEEHHELQEACLPMEHPGLPVR
ncbi:uncharacterized protein EI97DRAFT_319960 [Westerdykella ornata]|uniref:Uncharacterized protein n=1 Tax=Westerdykella ornata TaxID=318751 RepID=A0A6A6JLB2_WESOR|nr:uncharacterized protein EI97DRAFT_319960 [Westerdykella ornata]KAF2276738.1 hypothetical protein EI97DRAFT_319960 [Westerdykella ornata]